MFPRYSSDILGGAFFCRVLNVLSTCNVQLRTTDMEDAYEQLDWLLQDFYMHQGTEWLLDLGELYEGLSCVVFRHNRVSRGEVVYFDEEGYSEIFLIDQGVSEFCELHHLFAPHPLCSVIPALSLECQLHALDRLDTFEAEAILSEFCDINSELVGILVSQGNRGEPTVIRLLDDTHQDISGLVIERLAVDIPFDMGSHDEGFEEMDE